MPTCPGTKVLLQDHNLMLKISVRMFLKIRSLEIFTGVENLLEIQDNVIVGSLYPHLYSVKPRELLHKSS